MSLQDVAFFGFAGLTILAGLGVVAARNPVRSVLSLILAFLTSAGLFVLVGAEFVAMLLVIVYVGAVAVLFLFVVMMLDVDFAALRAGLARHLPFGLLTGVVLLLVLGLEFGNVSLTGEMVPGLPREVAPEIDNATALGRVIYTEHVFLFQCAGLILLVAMIGAIVLTLRQREGVRRQDPVAQMQRDPARAVELRDPDIGEGIG